tara:strand:+ start:324 stop:740 length:417 start_codon:yes stop_codon:yes gene_type:complete
MSTLRTNALEGVDAKNSITIVAGAGNVTTTNVQEGLAKAWANANHDTDTLEKSFNVSTFSDVATGEGKINYTSFLDAANYCIQVNGKTDNDNTDSTGNRIWVRPFGSNTSDASSFATDSGGTERDCKILCFTTYGDLA